MKKLPKHCQGQAMGFFDMIKAKLGGFVQLPTNECLEYHKALRATPHSQVTPVQVDSFSTYRTILILLFFQGFIDDFCSTIRYPTWDNR